MRSIVFEGNTWTIYEDLRLKDKILHKNLCKIIKEMQRGNPENGISDCIDVKILFNSCLSPKEKR